MPLTNKGEEIRSNMKQQYGAEKGEQVFYASKNKGIIAGVDAMSSREKLKDALSKTDSKTIFDAFMARRKLKKDAFEEVEHPRQAQGVFAPKGEEGKEDTQIDPGSLSKRNMETR